MSGADWITANQRLLVEEFARIKARLAGEQSAEASHGLEAARAAMPAPAAIDVLGEMFGLTAFERDIVLLCAGVEMDSAIADTCERLDGRQGPTFGLALSCLSEPHWNALTPQSALRGQRLIEVRRESNLTSSRIRIDERVMHFLAGVNELDLRIQPYARPLKTGAVQLPESHLAVLEAVWSGLLDHGSDRPTIMLHGADDVAKTLITQALARRLGMRCYRLRAKDLPADPEAMSDLAALWHREAMLLDAMLLLESREEDSTIAARFGELVDSLVVLSVPKPMPLERPHLRLMVDLPSAREQHEMLISLLGDSSRGLTASLDQMSAHFRLSTEAILKIASHFHHQYDDTRDADSLLWQACKAVARKSMGDLAQRIEPRATWEDLVLPPQQITTLRQICAHVRHRSEVQETWGFAAKCARGLGISVLFAGESGTGKTMAAEVIANELRLDLYRVDLAALISKYIGETEKNLAKVFDAAESSGGILLFDEADALFGKRSEVKDSHDRYANMEVSYLLQRMEAYRGLAILTSNLRQSMDDGFKRRLRFVLQFSFPDAGTRERIWQRSFPPQAPLATLDWKKLAQLNVAGGNIRNIAMGAAFLAADAGTRIGMSQLLVAARCEAAKRERPFSDAETRGWQ